MPPRESNANNAIPPSNTYKSQMASLISNFVPRILLDRFRKTYGFCHISRVPLDVYVDCIFIYLDVEDIVSLRQVSKAFYLLTHEPIIWRRFLVRLDIPVPPLRPTFRYSYRATDHEIEQLVIQAITVDDNFRREDPKVVSRRLLLSYNKVLDMYLLPGGKFLIASVKDRCNFRFYLVIYALDHHKGPRAIARVPTMMKAYNVHARFMKVFGSEDGLVIGYTRRRFRTGAPVWADANDYSTRTDADIDPPEDFFYQSVCLYISMEKIEELSDPDLDIESREYIDNVTSSPPPFLELTTVESEYEIEDLQVFEKKGMPFLAVIHAINNEIIFIDLLAKTMMTLCPLRWLKYQDYPHQIRAFRPHPGQTDMVIVRSVKTRTGEVQLIEAYDIPDASGLQVLPHKGGYELRKSVASVHISDYDVPGPTGPDQPDLCYYYDPAPPVSIYLRLKNPSGLLHHAIYPIETKVKATATAPAHYEYEYKHNAVHVTTHISDPEVAHVLPGATRAVVYTVDKDDRTDFPKMLRLRRYNHPFARAGKYQEALKPEPEPISRRKRKPILRKTLFRTFGPQDIVEEINNRGGVAAIAWDEGSGRICVAAEKENEVRILDCSYVTIPDARFAEWKRKQAALNNPSEPL